ncbi:hypothetical protein M9H77_08966 [Catharanthus roseus]|uniref:Uncharacterized protein n=1 Tax=Catharanthus roseus TaxID=4058 RepID=A0ACC0BZB4_CATRO|nr:hypothetical protein M9H77_08966 [Catharanthus roseus]
MVRPSGRRRYDDLGPVTNRTGRVQGRTITASSRGAPKSSTQPLPVPFRSRPLLPSHLSHIPVLYEAYGSAHQHSQPPPAVYDPYLAAPTVRSHIPYRSLAQEPLTEFSGPARQGLGEEPDRVRSLHIRGEEDERADDGGDGDGDDDDSEDAGDKEQPVPLAPVAPTSRSNGRPSSREREKVDWQFYARDVQVPTQRKRVKASD